MTSSTAHGVMAVNSWMLPPVVGYSTEVSHEDVNTLSTFNIANLTAKQNIFCKDSNQKKKQKGERTHIEIVVATSCHQRPHGQPNHRT